MSFKRCRNEPFAKDTETSVGSSISAIFCFVLPIDFNNISWRRCLYRGVFPCFWSYFKAILTTSKNVIIQRQPQSPPILMRSSDPFYPPNLGICCINGVVLSCNPYILENYAYFFLLIRKTYLPLQRFRSG